MIRGMFKGNATTALSVPREVGAYSGSGGRGELQEKIERVKSIARALSSELENVYCLTVDVERIASARALSDELEKTPPDVQHGIDFYREVEHFESGLIKQALSRAGGNQRRAARLLHMNATTLNSKIKLYGIDARRSAASRIAMLKILRAETDDDFEQARSLFEEYAASLGIDLGFQHFDEELSNLPAQYSLPNGVLLLAFSEDQTAGCVALRKLDRGVCEMKRLYVNPQFRSLKIGRLLAEKIVEEAQKLGYNRIRLDTLPSMTQAQSLYKSLGFREIVPYRFNPVEGAVFMELRLQN